MLSKFSHIRVSGINTAITKNFYFSDCDGEYYCYFACISTNGNIKDDIKCSVNSRTKIRGTEAEMKVYFIVVIAIVWQNLNCLHLDVM